MSNRLKLALASKRRPQRTVPVVLDGQLREQIEAVEDALDRLDEAPAKGGRLNSKSSTAERAQLVADLDRLRVAAEEATAYLVLEGLSDTAWLALKKQHPALPVEGEKQNVNDAYALLARFNIDTIRRPLIKACVVGQRDRPNADAPISPVEPGEIDELLEFINTRQTRDLSDAAYALCEKDDAVPLPRQRSQTATSDVE